MTTQDEALVERLREIPRGQGHSYTALRDDVPCHCVVPYGDMINAAADAIERLAKERDEAWFRLGTLGLSVAMSPDLEGLAVKLGTMGSHGHKSYPTHFINPDGREAWAAIEALNTRATAAEARAAELAEALAPFALALRPEIPDEKLIDTVAWPAFAHRQARAALAGVATPNTSDAADPDAVAQGGGRG